jgi:hypothetical protein
MRPSGISSPIIMVEYKAHKPALPAKAGQKASSPPAKPAPLAVASDPKSTPAIAAGPKSGAAVAAGSDSTLAGAVAPKPAAAEESAPAPAAPARKPEIGGPKGPEPTRYGDWEKGGRCIDF